MRQVGKFKLFEISEFAEWLNLFNAQRTIKIIQQHHTFIPAYKDFDGNKHFKLCESMERAHVERGFDQIGQNFTTFPDGKIMLCRDLNIQPAGIKFHNFEAICLEHIGNFDRGADSMTQNHKATIVESTRLLLNRFNISPSKHNLVYHHWFDLNTGERLETEGVGIKKSCPGTNFFGGNTVSDYNSQFLQLFIS